MTDDINLGRLLGRHEAFSVVAARCSAADAALIREMRDKKLYEGHAQDWDEFCAQQLHMSRTSANRIIRLLEEFGPAYFEVAQLTRISPATYRAIAPAIADHSIQHDGQPIALIPENAEKVAAAVAELRKNTARPEPQPDSPSFRGLADQCAAIVSRFGELVRGGEGLGQVVAAIGTLRKNLEEIERSARRLLSRSM